MTTLVEIESETLKIIFKSLEADVELLKMATVKKWTTGEEHYKKRIKTIFSGLKRVESMIDKVTETFQNDIDDYKDGTNTASNANTPDNYVLRVRQEMLHIKAGLRTKLNQLRSINWERDLRIAGFQEFETTPPDTLTATRRTDDGILRIHNLDDGTVQTLDDF